MAIVTCFVTLVALVYGTTAQLMGDVEVSNWRRGTTKSNFNEFTLLSEKGRTILMSSSDHARLPKYTMASISLHDFEARGSRNGLGLVALKLLGEKGDVCLITDVAKPWTETKEELRKRAATRGEIPVQTANYLYKPKRRIARKELALLSRPLHDFCGYSPVYRLHKALIPIDLPPRYPPWRTLCIWIPYPIDMADILQEFKPIGY